MTPRKLKILQVAPACPFPPENGQRVGIWKRTMALSKLGHEVDLLATSRLQPTAEEAATMLKHTRRMRVVDRLPNWQGLTSQDPVQIATRVKLASVELEQEYDVVLIEGEACIRILDNPKLAVRRKVLRIHNDEVRFFREQISAEPRLWRKAYFHLEARRYTERIPAIHARADQLWFVSFDEWAAWAKVPGNGTKGVWLPPAVQIDQLRTNHSTSARVLFLGTLAFPGNVNAMEWFYRNVHPLLQPIPDYHLVVAGNSLGEKLAPIFGEIENDARCSLVKDVPDLKPLFDSCSVFVSPIQRGAGVKMKVLSAIEAGLPVVSTTVGCEGIGLAHEKQIIIADSIPEFARGVKRLLADAQLRRTLAAASQDQLKERFDQEQRLSELLAALVGR